LASFLHDFRYSLRTLRKTPGFTAVTAATLALGIGANTAIFSLIDGVLLRPLPYQDPGRLVLLWERTPQLDGMSISWLNYLDWKAQNRVFAGIAARQDVSFNLTGIADPERLEGSNVTADLFEVLGVRAARGRTFLPEEDRPGSGRVVVISDSLWERRFGRDTKILGRALTLDGNPCTVVGVMPRGFRYPARALHADVYAPLGRKSDEMQERWNHPGIFAIARLKSGVPIERARIDLDTIARGLEQRYPNSNRSNRVGMDFYHALTVRSVRSSLLVLLGAVGFVLLIACANVANLLLARAAGRGQEIAVRAALGAGRGQIVRQLLTESVALSLFGGALGLALAWWGLHVLIAVAPEGTPRLAEVGIDLRVLGFTILLSTTAGIAFGLAPALHVSRGNLHDAFKGGGQRMSANLHRHRLRAVLVVAEVALSFVLLVGAGVTLRSFARLTHASPGFEPQNVLSLAIDLPESQYRTPVRRLDFFNQLLERTRELPGIVSAGLITPLPLSGSVWQSSIRIEGRVYANNDDGPMSDMARVTPDYFRTMGVPLIKGRVFTPHDGDGAPPVAVVDETLAKTYFPNEDPIGKRLLVNGRPAQIVGIVGHLKNNGVDELSRIETYLPFFQSPVGSADLVVRTSGDPGQLAAPIATQVRKIDPNQPVSKARTMEWLFDQSIAPKRLSTMLLGVFAGIAVLLATVGLYGAIAYSVTQRTQEIGIRIAVGAEPAHVLKLVIGQALGLVGIGLAIGLAGALAQSRLLETLLFGVSPTDPATLAEGAALIGAIGLLACYLPARRAALVSPVVALRHE
jgi:putative ABC transport system permease protein